MSVRRRPLLAFAATSALIGTDAFAKKDVDVPALALDIAIAQFEGQPVVSDEWVNRQVSEAQRLMSAHGVTVGLVERRTLGEDRAVLENADDRDAMSQHLAPKVINAFIVKSLRDVDKPDRFIRGVRWRNRRDLRKDYVILATIAGPFTLCHELGHFLGNGHSYVVNNVMSYKHEDYDKIAFDKSQGNKMRLVARRLLATKRVASVADHTRDQAGD